MSFFSFTNKSNSNPLKKPISSKDAKILPKDYIPKRLGVKYDPPIISFYNKLKILN